MNNSPRFSLNWLDWQKWISNTLLFLAPVAVIYFGFVATNLQDGFSWSDFSINSITAGAIMLYVVNTVLDLARKYVRSPQ